MDNKEAIEYLKWIRPVKPYSLDKIKVQESIDFAIKTLEERPQGDLISRDALIDVLKTELANVPQPDTDADYYVGVHQGLKLAETIIDNASSVYDNPYSDGKEDGYIEGYEEAKRECELQGEFTDLEREVTADAINYLLGAELLEENGYTEEVINALKSALQKLGAEENHL